MIKRIIIFLFFFTALSPNLYAQETQVQHIPSSQYFETALNEINSAKSSIRVFMYLISVIPDQPDSQANQCKGVKSLLDFLQ